ncbi:hypothetical protein MHPYR_70166 [uncultured Mycobacterium sp.]|uniref:Uncharacterized protein n=1 Tax=uncultured Mycobacterium sp. TaxID=171292 RepID=A0A1Y5PKS1_9MYCO|nr:hypothetical protein MHPYR_70166 [uncultured Mycobacterium sp.]
MAQRADLVGDHRAVAAAAVDRGADRQRPPAAQGRGTAPVQRHPAADPAVPAPRASRAQHRDLRSATAFGQRRRSRFPLTLSAVISQDILRAPPYYRTSEGVRRRAGGNSLLRSNVEPFDSCSRSGGHHGKCHH